MKNLNSELIICIFCFFALFPNISNGTQLAEASSFTKFSCHVFAHNTAKKQTSIKGKQKGKSLINRINKSKTAKPKKGLLNLALILLSLLFLIFAIYGLGLFAIASLFGTSEALPFAIFAIALAITCFWGILLIARNLRKLQKEEAEIKN